MLMAACAIALGSLGACATDGPPSAVARLTSEQLAAIPLPGPEAAKEATRLTQQADREAQSARVAEQRRELELQRWRDYEQRYRWSLGLGLGHGHRHPRYGIGAGFYFP